MFRIAFQAVLRTLTLAWFTKKSKSRRKRTSFELVLFENIVRVDAGHRLRLVLHDRPILYVFLLNALEPLFHLDF